MLLKCRINEIKLSIKKSRAKLASRCLEISVLK